MCLENDFTRYENIDEFWLFAALATFQCFCSCAIQSAVFRFNFWNSLRSFGWPTIRPMCSTVPDEYIQTRLLLACLITQRAVPMLLYISLASNEIIRRKFHSAHVFKLCHSNFLYFFGKKKFFDLLFLLSRQWRLSTLLLLFVWTPSNWNGETENRVRWRWSNNMQVHS